MADTPDEEPKIIVDSDWKSQAQAERDKLAEAEAASASEPDPRGLPPADFRGLVEMIATQALLYLGGVPDQSGKAMFDPGVARHMIDLLGVIEEKTKGNLTDEESTMVTQLLGDLRARYVELARMVAEQQAQGGAGPIDPGAGGGQPPIVGA